MPEQAAATPTPPPAGRPTVPKGAARRLLVVEDDRAIADAVVRRLVSEGYRVDAVHDGPAAVAAAAAARYDAIVLDLMLPGLDGLEVCRRVQAADPVPVLMLTARAEEADRLIGLAVGADDYLVKPFSPRELVARVAALIRRVDREAARMAAAAAASSGPIEVGGLRLDAAARRAWIGAAPVELTRTEFDLLHALALHPGEVITREALLAEVWAWSPVAAASAGASAGRAIDSHIKSLRRKIGADRIRTVYGVGYAIEALP